MSRSEQLLKSLRPRGSLNGLDFVTRLLHLFRNEAEVREAIEHGSREPAKLGRELCRFNFAFGQFWQDSTYAIKQVAPVIKEEPDEIVVITVYTFHF